MKEYLLGLFAGALIVFSIMHLIYQKRLTRNGWVDKSENVKKFWFSTVIFSITAFVVTLYMIYT